MTELFGHLELYCEAVCCLDWIWSATNFPFAKATQGLRQCGVHVILGFNLRISIPRLVFVMGSYIEVRAGAHSSSL